MGTSRKVRKIGTVRYSDLVPGTARDVAGALAAALNARRKVTETYDPEFVSPAGAQAAAAALGLELDIALVDPGKLKSCTPEVLARSEIARYETAWKEGARFPPVVIDSRLTWRKMLHEGWHRTCSAQRVGLTELEAIDVGSADFEKLDRWIKERQEG